MQKHFHPTPQTQEELKKLYRKLAHKHHPDAGGDAEIMKEINAEYKALFAKVGSTHTNAKGERYEKATGEAPEHFINIINELIRFEGVLIEIIGTFIWVSGNTKPYKEQLKEMGFKWSPNKSSWYLAPEGYRSRSRQNYEMDDIRRMYGSQEVKHQQSYKIAANE